jgi:iron complex transport system substrate-binding protein
MRVFSHTCSNTEIVCALGCEDMLVGIDADSDFPADVVAPLPKFGRDLDLDVDAALALQPDLVLTSLTVPGHERIVAAFETAGIHILVCDPRSLDDVYGDIRRIAAALGVSARGNELVASMRAAMPRVETDDAARPKVLVEWWPKPVIAPARESWVTDIIELAGGRNPWREVGAKSMPLEDAQILAAGPDAIVMSWCGVREENYRPDVVRRRPGWSSLPAVRNNVIAPITEAWLGRPGPRLVEGYRALRKLLSALSTA